MSSEEYIPKERRSSAIVREIFDWLESGITAVLWVVLVFTFGVRMMGVIGQSMEPSLQNGDRLLATRLYERLEYGDIVVITKPNSRNEPLIKRVIATEGQVVDIDNSTGDVYIDGTCLEELYIGEKIRPGAQYDVDFPQEVPTGHVFVMGDNRNNSWDSRSAEIGVIDERWITGKVIYRVWPYESFGRPPHIDDFAAAENGGE